MRYVLRRTAGSYSSGTPVEILGRPNEDGKIRVRPWCSAEAFVIEEGDVVRLRRRRETPDRRSTTPPPKYVRVRASLSVHALAGQLGILDLEGQLEQAVRSGRTWPSLPDWLPGRDLAEGQRCASLRGGPGAVAVLDREPSISRKVHLVRVVRLVVAEDASARGRRAA